VQRALAKSPDDRFATAAEFAAALRAPDVGTIAARRPRARHAARWPWFVLAFIIGAAATTWIVAMRTHDTVAVTADDARAIDAHVIVAVAGSDASVVVADAAVVEVTSPDAATARRTIPTGSPSHRPVSSKCQCIPTAGPDIVALCPSKGPMLCRCDTAAGRSLCSTALASCNPVDLDAMARALDKNVDELCTDIGGKYVGCPDHLYDRFHTIAVHGDACTGYLVYSPVEGSLDVKQQPGKWYCDVCSTANTHSFSGRTGDRCDGFYWHTGQPLTGTLQHCD
jgi:hypothetical protein